MTEEEVLRIHRDVFYRALLHRDWEALLSLYDDRYMLIRPDGATLSKAEVLSDLRGGGLTFHAIELTHERVRLSGTTALLTGESRTTAERNGSRTESRVQLLAVYVSDGQAIRLLHFQSTTLGNTT